MKKKGVKNLTFTQRLQIETLFNANHSTKEIAEIVGVRSEERRVGKECL